MGQQEKATPALTPTMTTKTVTEMPHRKRGRPVKKEEALLEHPVWVERVLMAEEEVAPVDPRAGDAVVAEGGEEGEEEGVVVEASLLLPLLRASRPY